MVEGKKVICVDDKFDPWVHAHYKQLPKKDETYTIRKVRMGRDKIVSTDADGNLIKGGASADENITVLILLEELHNDLDPIQLEHLRQELGFNAIRFRELEESTSFEFKEEHMLGTIKIETPELVPA